MAKKSNRKWIIIGILALIGILIALAFFRKKGETKGTRVNATEVDRRTISETVSASGKIYPKKEVKISSDVSGEVVDLYVQEGDSVKVGQLLAKIDPEAYMSSVERGKASVNNSKAQLANTKAQVESSRAQRSQSLAQLENNKKNHARNQQLFKEGIISQQEFDQSLGAVKQAEANLQAADANLKSMQESVEAATYSVKSTEASLKELQTNLNRTRIKAPSSGIISRLTVEQGERVVGTSQMSGTEMMRIANLNNMEVQVNVSENDILRVALGDRVDINVDAYLDHTFRGKVTQISNSASNIATTTTISTDQVTNFVVKVTIDPSSYEKMSTKGIKYPLRPGMSASVDIYTDEKKNALSIPLQAVTVREGEKDKDSGKKELDEIVFKIVEDTVQAVKVVTGIQNSEYIVVKDGLQEGDRIVEGPYSVVSKKLKEGDRIRIKEKKK